MADFRGSTGSGGSVASEAAAAARKQPPKSDPLAAGVRAIHAEAGGCLDIFIVGEADAPALILDAVEGSRVAAALLRHAADLAGKAGALTGKRTLCLCCPNEITAMRGVRIGLAAPSRSDPSVAMAFALCPACAAAGDAEDRVLSGLRRIWPEGRRGVVTHPEGGRA
jgi:hypothetical protein